MEKLHCSYLELLETPQWVIEDALLVMEAEAKAGQARAAEMRSQDGRRR